MSAYDAIIEKLFLEGFKKGLSEIQFEREDLSRVAGELGVQLPKNLGDIIYSFRYRKPLPKRVVDTAPKGLSWVIRSKGRAAYAFCLTKQAIIEPTRLLNEAKLLDATPGIVEKYAMTDEQSLLAKVRYNRLVDIFLGIACYSLQNHLRTAIPGMGQIETDELYVGVDANGAHYIIPVQAKGNSDTVGIIQLEQDFELCRCRFPAMIARPLAIQFVESDLIAMFSFTQTSEGVRIEREKHYRLVSPEGLSDEEIKRYATMQLDR